MSRASNRWALVLAAGSGTRMSSITRDGSGKSVPKQYCSLNGGASLLERALARAASVAAPERTIVIVAAEHEQHWRSALRKLPHVVIVQPRNRGTANGILLGVSAILERDSEALVAIVPSDHYVAREAVLARALERAMAAVAADRRASVGFLGIEPDSADPELGYIVRGAPNGDGSATVARFVEKPPHTEAANLLEARALWNSFILVARAATLGELIAQRFPIEVAAFRQLWQQRLSGARLQSELERLYDTLPEVDFSRHVVEGTTAPLHVVPVPACGWNDLGTPQRVMKCLEELGGRAQRPREPARHFDLADAYLRLIAGTTAQPA